MTTDHTGIDQRESITKGRPIHRRAYGDEAAFDAYDEALLRVLAESELTSLPGITRMDFGHTDPKFVLPIGVAAEIDCEGKQIRLLELVKISLRYLDAWLSSFVDRNCLAA